MPTPTTYPSAKRVTGGAKETTQGTAVQPPTFTIPLDSFEPKDVIGQGADKGLRGSMADQYGNIALVRRGEFTASGAFFADVTGNLLLNILGDLTTTPGSPNSHAFALLNTGTAQPPSHTLAQWQGLPATNQSRLWPGASLSELTFKGNTETGLVMCEWKGQSWPSQISGSLITYSPSVISPIAAWRTAIGLGGTAVGAPNKTIEEWSITITREIKAQFTAQNLDTPYIIQRGPLAVTGDLKVTKPSDETVLLYYLNNTIPQLQIVVDNGVVGANQLNLQIDVQQAAFAPVAVDFADLAIGYSASFTAMANTTNAGASGGSSPIKVTLKNAVASY